MKYGRRNEKVAIEDYKAAMRSHGHLVSVMDAGFVVSPRIPWVGASPDGFIRDSSVPAEHGMGVLEIKCPFSLRDATPSKMCDAIGLTQDEDSLPKVNCHQAYYYQILTQMALSGAKWGDFVVRSEKWIFIERIFFDENTWKDIEEKVGESYFSTFLPFLSQHLNCDSSCQCKSTK
jgi:hypothetical protein